MKVNKNCKTCDKIFKSYDVGLRINNIFCSINCKSIDQKDKYRRTDKRVCVQCSDEFTTIPSNPKKYCTRSCQHKSLIFYDKLDEDQKLNLLRVRYAKFVLIKDGCWGWKGTKVKGYGVITFNDKHNFAHRISWQVHIGKIPAGKHILHKCDNKECSNPEHLFLGSHRDNMIDMRSKGLHKQYSKLKSEQVIEIRNLISKKIPLKQIAKQFLVSFSAIYDIKIMKTWKHLPI